MTEKQNANKTILRSVFMMIALWGTLSSILLMKNQSFMNSFLFYFTGQSNIMVCIYYLAELFSRIIMRRKYPVFHPAFQGGILLYILVTGIIYNVLLAPGLAMGGYWRIITQINHTVTPLLFLFDWILNNRKSNYTWKQWLLWMIYPAVYCICGIIRGGLTSEFKYPFFDYTSKPLPHFIIELVVIITFFLLLGMGILCLSRIGNRRKR